MAERRTDEFAVYRPPPPPPRASAEPPYAGPMPGAVLAKRYLLEEKIGRGATSVVFRAHDLEEQRAVAVKVLSLPGRDRVHFERFKRELHLARRLEHPNIAALYELDLGGEPPFIAMELLIGEDLDTVVEAGLTTSRAVDVLAQAAAGLGYAHAAGIIHRDVKSENLFLTTAGTLKVMDFGMAKARGSRSLTGDDLTGGTPLYIAPEQIRDFRRVTHRADIYSLGIVAYELFTGRLPFESDQLVGLLQMHLESTPADPREHRPDLPRALAELVLAMLAKDPDERVPDCSAVRARLMAAGV
ncbi:MAG: serine/threonine protein kinase [Polyangiaceae bacterium]|nr:serine/threonine protein kinase [Polyangiaceae bacterium]